MLAVLGLVTVTLLIVGIMSKRVSPLVALTLIPIAAALIGGFGWATGGFIMTGLKTVAPIALMLVFAILFFGIMTDAGMFTPVIRGILKTVGRRPRRIVVGTAVLAALVQLDGSGAVTFLIVIPAMISLYDSLGMDRRVLACAAAMSAGLNNILPWGGPAIRAATALQVPVETVYNPLIPVHGVGMLAILAIAYWLGWREEKRLNLTPAAAATGVATPECGQALPETRNLWFNIGLTLVVLVAMLSSKVEPFVAFMAGTVVALVVNFRGQDEQQVSIDTHAKSCLMMVTILGAAGVFMGIMRESGMLTAMARQAVDLLPDGSASLIPGLVAVLSVPLSLLFDPDSFYFGILPVAAEVAAQGGIHPVEVAQAALMGQMTVGFPISPLTPATYLLISLAGISLADHQRFSLPYLFLVSLIMTMAGFALGLFSW